MKKSNKTQKAISIKEIYQELLELQSLYKIEHESLWSCYDEERDYFHIFSISEIFKEKLKTVILNIKAFS